MVPLQNVQGSTFFLPCTIATRPSKQKGTDLLTASSPKFHFSKSQANCKQRHFSSRAGKNILSSLASFTVCTEGGKNGCGLLAKRSSCTAAWCVPCLNNMSECREQVGWHSRVFPNMIGTLGVQQTNSQHRPLLGSENRLTAYGTLLGLKVRRVRYGIHFDHLWSTIYIECDLQNGAVIAPVLRSARSPGGIPTRVPSLQGLIQLGTGRFKKSFAARLSKYCMHLYALIKSWCRKFISIRHRPKH